MTDIVWELEGLLMNILNIRRIMWEESGNKTLDKPKIKSNGHNFKTFLLDSV